MVVYSVGTAAIKLRQKTSKSGLYCIILLRVKTLHAYFNPASMWVPINVGIEF